MRNITEPYLIKLIKKYVNKFMCCCVGSQIGQGEPEGAARQGAIYIDETESGLYYYDGTGWIQLEAGGGGAVSSVNGDTGIVVLNQDDVLDGTIYKQYSQTEKTKLSGIATGATVNDTNANLRDRTTHTGVQAQATITGLVADLAAKAPLASPTFTGTPTLPTGTIAVTQTAGNSTTAIATTAFVTTADNLKANLASPTFTGTPAAPTAAAGTNTTQLATTAFVTTADNLKANLASPTFTGLVTTPLIKITSGNPGLGKVLTSDADGDASWETPSSGVIKQLCLLVNLSGINAATNNANVSYSIIQGESSVITSFKVITSPQKRLQLILSDTIDIVSCTNLTSVSGKNVFSRLAGTGYIVSFDGYGTALEAIDSTYGAELRIFINYFNNV